jgi:hypothetical protein
VEGVLEPCPSPHEKHYDHRPIRSPSRMAQVGETHEAIL